MRTSTRRLRVSPPAAATLAEQFVAVRRELNVPSTFPDAVRGEAAAATPDSALSYEDATGLPFLTIDPAGSVDLDQAMHLARSPGGYRFDYAIADVGAFVRPGSVLDGESHTRGETLYSPDLRTPLYPAELSEGSASLLPDQNRPAVLWSFDLDERGEPVTTVVRRAHVRSRQRLDYVEVQAMLDGNDEIPEQIGLLREIGLLRQARERDRGGVSLDVPEQEVNADPAGGWRLEFRATLPCEDWNAQLSLLTGMAAARLMLDGGVGLLRTLPPPWPSAVGSLRRSAMALGVSWPHHRTYQEVVRGLDGNKPADAAILALATVLLRGAGYAAFDGTPPEQPLHSAVAAPYAHATAPLRRLADRYVNEVCLALSAGSPVPEWARASLPALPALMASADHRAHELDRAMVDLAEAVTLAGRVGDVFPATVVEVREAHDDHPARATVQLTTPAVRARCSGDLPLGQEVDVRLVTADVATRTVAFAPA
ncbi:RNB domain-containing ribonuclease [Acidothermaceae bacterium B102]|nr:RNB domain-containing ribonuclease [Acidothermaceae bacterium B102]